MMFFNVPFLYLIKMVFTTQATLKATIWYDTIEKKSTSRGFEQNNENFLKSPQSNLLVAHQ